MILFWNYKRLSIQLYFLFQRISIANVIKKMLYVNHRNRIQNSYNLLIITLAAKGGWLPAPHFTLFLLCIKFKASLPVPSGLIYRPFWPICFTLILLLSTTSMFSSQKSSFRWCRVKIDLPLSTWRVGCEKN